MRLTKEKPKWEGKRRPRFGVNFCLVSPQAMHEELKVKVIGTSVRVGLGRASPKWGDSVGKETSLDLPPEPGTKLHFRLGLRHLHDQPVLWNNTTKGIFQARMK